MRVAVTLTVLTALGSSAAEKPLITYQAPPSSDDLRPVITQVVFGPQGSDYAFRVKFDKVPWGEACRSRCANATLFLDTDNNRSTGLRLADAKAAETGADLAVTIQGVRELTEGAMRATLKVKITQYAEGATTPDQGELLSELTPADGERVIAEGADVYLLIDASSGNLPSAAKARLIYHPPDSKPLSGVGRGLASGASKRVEIFKQGKLSNPVKRRGDQ
jgi:hypothetical protein